MFALLLFHNTTVIMFVPPQHYRSPNRATVQVAAFWSYICLFGATCFQGPSYRIVILFQQSQTTLHCLPDALTATEADDTQFRCRMHVYPFGTYY